MSGTTGADGVVTLDLTSIPDEVETVDVDGDYSFVLSDLRGFLIVVKAKNGLVFTEINDPSFTTSSDEVSFRGEVYVDRKLIRPGEDVFVTGMCL